VKEGNCLFCLLFCQWRSYVESYLYSLWWGKLERNIFIIYFITPINILGSKPWCSFTL
jgi:hypothetical protein